MRWCLVLLCLLWQLYQLCLYLALLGLGHLHPLAVRLHLLTIDGLLITVRSNQFSDYIKHSRRFCLKLAPEHSAGICQNNHIFLHRKNQELENSDPVLLWELRIVRIYQTLLEEFPNKLRFVLRLGIAHLNYSPRVFYAIEPILRRRRLLRLLNILRLQRAGLVLDIFRITLVLALSIVVPIEAYRSIESFKQ